MTEQIKEARIHPWVYYIAPMTNGIYFTAFCKACRTYFVERMPERFNNATTSPSNLPRYGCEPISEDVTQI